MQEHIDNSDDYIRPFEREEQADINPTGSQAPAPVPPYILDEAAPLVLMDTRLGKKHSNVDFDYEAFMWRAVTYHDMSDENITKLSLYIKPSRRFTFGGRANYLPGANDITIKARKQQTANKSLRHELKHAADDADGLLKANVRYIVGKLAIYPLVVTELAMLLGVIAELENVRLPVVAKDVAIGSFCATAASVVGGYTFHPMERRARKAARAKKQDIIGMERHKPLLSTKLKQIISEIITSPVGGTGGFTIGSAELPK
jgi:hypothetical protein